MQSLQSALRALLEAGADPSPKDSKGAPPLFYAVAAMSVPCVLELLHRGADLTATDASGRTPLHIAARTGVPELISMILEASPGLTNALDRHGVTPLYHAAMVNDVDPVAAGQALHCLLAAGASEVITPMTLRAGTSCLHMSVQGGNEVSVRILLKHLEAVGGYDAVPK